MRQISGEVYAAAQASTSFDVTGEESPNGAPRKMHAFCGVPGLEGESNSPRDVKFIQSVLEHDETPVRRQGRLTQYHATPFCN